MGQPTPSNRHERRTVEKTDQPPSTDTTKRASYSVKHWCQQVSISPAFFYELKNKGLIDTAKIFGKVLVLTDPREFVESFREKVS
ncbi:MAG: hypothetical protein WCF85_17360 [Rhodospirillaceae bacterium]